MADRWTIVFDIEAARKIEQWPRQNRLDLPIILDLLTAEGPLGLGWDPVIADVTSWSRLCENTGLNPLTEESFRVPIGRYPRQSARSAICRSGQRAFSGPECVFTQPRSDLEQPYRRVFWTAAQARFYRLSLEVLPGNAVRISDASHGVSKYWR